MRIRGIKTIILLVFIALIALSRTRAIPGIINFFKFNTKQAKHQFTLNKRDNRQGRFNFKDETKNGAWNIIRRIEYKTIPKENLKGNIESPYLYYAVQLAGFYSNDTGVTLGPDDDVRYTRDGGRTWTKSKGALNCRYGLDLVDNRVAWHSGNGGIRFSTDGWRSWTTVAPTFGPHISFINSRFGWIATQHSIKKTKDSGRTWDKLKLPASISDIAAIRVRGTQNGYILDSKGQLFITDDGAKSWKCFTLDIQKGQGVLSSSGGIYAAIRFFDKWRGIVIYGLVDHSVWSAVTYDGGKSWTKQRIPGLYSNIYYNNIYLSNDGSILTATRDYKCKVNYTLVLNYQFKINSPN